MDTVWGTDAGSLQGYRSPQNIVQGTYPQLILFIVFQMWASHAGLPLLLAITVFSKHVKRDATFINLCLAFIIIGISSSLLVYGRALRGPEPPPMLCLLQASLLYGMPTLASGAACMLVVQMFLRIRAAHYGKSYEDDDYPIRRWTMLGFPYIVYFIPVLATAVIGARNPERVSRNRRFFYCSLDCLPLTNGICIFSAIILLGTVALIVSSIVLLVRQRKVRSNLRVSLDLSLPIRIMVFGLYLIAAMSISLLSVWSPSSPVPDLVIASAATFVILIFGTQMDIIRVLCFWKRRRVVTPIQVDVAAVVDLKSAFEGVSTDNKPKTAYGLKPGV